MTKAAKKKAAPKKDSKKRAEHYEPKLKIEGSFSDVIGVAMGKKEKPKSVQVKVDKVPHDFFYTRVKEGNMNLFTVSHTHNNLEIFLPAIYVFTYDEVKSIQHSPYINDYDLKEKVEDAILKKEGFII